MKSHDCGLQFILTSRRKMPLETCDLSWSLRSTQVGQWPTGCEKKRIDLTWSDNRIPHHTLFVTIFIVFSQSLPFFLTIFRTKMTVEWRYSPFWDTPKWEFRNSGWERPTQKKERFTHKTLMPIDRLLPFGQSCQLELVPQHGRTADASKIHGSGGERKPRLREFNDSYLKAQQASPQPGWRIS